MRQVRLLAIFSVAASSGCSIHTHYSLIDDYTRPFVDAAAQSLFWEFVVVAAVSAIIGGIVVWSAIKWQWRRRLGEMLIGRKSAPIDWRSIGSVTETRNDSIRQPVGTHEPHQLDNRVSITS